MCLLIGKSAPPAAGHHCVLGCGMWVTRALGLWQRAGLLITQHYSYTPFPTNVSLSCLCVFVQFPFCLKEFSPILQGQGSA